jgi:hypothetical protein
VRGTRPRVPVHLYLCRGRPGGLPPTRLTCFSQSFSLQFHMRFALSFVGQSACGLTLNNASGGRPPGLQINIPQVGVSKSDNGGQRNPTIPHGFKCVAYVPVRHALLADEDVRQSQSLYDLRDMIVGFLPRLYRG